MARSIPARRLVITAAILAAIVIAALSLLIARPSLLRWWSPGWNPDELSTLESLWIGSLAPLPVDLTNQFADDPQAIRLGHALFFDTRLSANGQVSCATCHQPERLFTDGEPVAQGISLTTRNTPTIVGTAYSPWLFLDGRADSLWSQALGPLESVVEHGGTRTFYAHLIDQYYSAEYEAVFGSLPDLSDPQRYPASAGPVDSPQYQAAWEGMAPADQQAVNLVFANLGKALAAYQRQLTPGPSRFDAYVAALLAGDARARRAALTPDEVAGLEIFIGAGECLKCHNGPLLTNNEFHNLGVPDPVGAAPDEGRKVGVLLLLESEFNCLGPYSDASPDDCADLRFIKSSGHELERAFRTPSLRNVSQTAPYGHAGQFATLQEVLDFYNRAPQPAAGHTELAPLNLTVRELAQLEAFLLALDGKTVAPLEFLTAPGG